MTDKAGDNLSPPVTAHLVWSCVAVCPECGYDNDLAETDKHFSALICRGDWNKASGYLVECALCENVFTLKKVECEQEPAK